MPGPPLKYKKELDDVVYKLSLAGLTNERIASHIGIHEATFYDWIKENGSYYHASLSEALKRGREGAVSKVVESLLQKATGYEMNEKYYPADTAAMIFFLKNKLPEAWKDKRETEVSGDAASVLSEIAKKLPV